MFEIITKLMFKLAREVLNASIKLIFMFKDLAFLMKSRRSRKIEKNTYFKDFFFSLLKIILEKYNVFEIKTKSMGPMLQKPDNTYEHWRLLVRA